MSYGFTINRILVRGSDVEDAELVFSKDVTVVAGLSNTGKTYVFQCMKYLLGSDTLPKKIDESYGYDKAYLELKLHDGTYNTVYRSLSGGGALLYRCKACEILHYKEEPEVLLAGSQSRLKNRTISEYYTALCGMGGKRVRKNASGVTEKVGFALMRHLSVVDEVSIIKEGSPILGGQLIHETKEKSFLKLLLTGEDDSSVVAKPKPNVVSNKKGKLEIIEAFLSEYKDELQGYQNISFENVEDRIEKLGEGIIVANSELTRLYEDVEQVESMVNENWQLWKEKKSRLLNVNELLVRFNLLTQHYETDIERLEAINEAGKAFSALEVTKCLVCNSFITGGHLCDVEQVDSIVAASEGEMSKIQHLKNDLSFNIDSLHKEREELEESIRDAKSRHMQAQKSANSFRSVRIRNQVEKIEAIRIKLRELKYIRRLLGKVDKLESQHIELKKEIDPKNEKYKFESLSTSLLTELSNNIKLLLTAWQYDDIKSVSFSENNVDFVINGNERNLSGKGYRALTYSSFILSLLKYCIVNNRPHSGVVILDSPLCTLRSRHVDVSDSMNDRDIIRDDMKDSFYEDLASMSGHGQVIIFENDGPNPNALPYLKYHKFTKGKSPGRYGFFPI